MRNFYLTLFHLSVDTYDAVRGLLLLLVRKKHHTKVFCIGVNKTGTTSLNKALGILGYRNIHWPIHGNSEQNRLLDYIRSSYFDAYSDYPIPKHYREIDKAFPNSKFILTIRDIPSWQKSAVKYFRDTPWELEGEAGLKRKTDYVIHHNSSVQNYFKDRPDDLLVMNIFKGDDFNKLCPFLNKPVPKQSFPHTNKGSRSAILLCKKAYKLLVSQNSR